MPRASSLLLWALLLLLLLPQQALAQEADTKPAEIVVSLTGGTLTAGESGVGRAEVEATVTNNSPRPLSAIRIGVFYNNHNEGPPPGVAWIPHEFVFEPPLEPGKNSVLRFTDNDAGEFVLIEIQRVLFGSGLTYNGELAVLASPLTERAGVVYIATRDFAAMLGAEVRFDKASDLVSLSRTGQEVRFQVGLSHAFVDGLRMELEQIPYLDGDKSYVPLETFAVFFGMLVDYDRALNLINLNEASSNP